jgi:hypothetical protein
MFSSMSKIFLFSILMISCWSFTYAKAQPVTYGDLMVQDRQDDLAGRNSVSLGGGYDVTNPYLNTYNADLRFSRDLSSVFALNLDALAFSAEKSRYNRRMENDLQAFGVKADDDRPSYAAFASLELKLLQGRVNLLGFKALPFRFGVRAGSGYIWDRDNVRTAAATWGLGPQVFFNPNWGAGLHFDQDLEGFWSSAENVYRNRLAASVSYVF